LHLKKISNMNQLLKPLLIAILCFGLFLSSFARPVDLETAKTVASKFMRTDNLQLAATYTTDRNAAAFYVFNSADGFVIVSADDCETPIIGYSREGRFDINNIPPQMEDYLQDFVARIQYGIENHINADIATAKQWELVKTTGQLNAIKNAKSVEPLLTESWHQGCLYNSLCPTLSKLPCGHAEVGCVAVAMGQIMHYWRYPTTGWGAHSYSNSGLNLSANFGNTIYDWEHMPDSLTDNSSEAEIEAVATLLFHCGVSVDMQYTTNGSGADSDDVPNALIRYFNYSRRLHIEKRSDFDDEEWMSMLKVCLNLQRPIYYGGRGDQGSHAFVCDGYDGNDLLHFNWGWGRANGYFALGHLNPIGFSFNEKNFAIFDINPEYEPWIVHATPFPPTAGTIEGNGEYHIGDQCTLTATPVENSKFCYWKKDGRIVSYDTSFSFTVSEDVDNIEACFSYKPLDEIKVFHAPDTNDMNSPYVSLSWEYDSINAWKLVKQFEINGESMITTDGEYIYTAFESYSDYPGKFGKYTLDGELVDSFNMEGAKPDGLTHDGTYFYCSKNTASFDICRLYCYDFENKMLLDSTDMGVQFSKCAYDSHYDAFWLLDFYPVKKISLVDRQGQMLFSVHIPSSLQYNIHGFGSLNAEDGNPHLLLFTDHACYDYDIVGNSFNDHHIQFLDLPGHSVAYAIGKHDGKDAVFVIVSSFGMNFIEIHHICIFEINCHLVPIKHYRLYRVDSEEHLVMLADAVTGNSYLDSTWNEANAGTYRFGISEVYFNGVESEIIWSDTIVKTNYGIDENEGGQIFDPSVHKLIEDGKIVIIKDGKRYNVSGQTLN